MKAALVTGGAVRIGRAIVEDLVHHGWAVAIHANRSRDQAETLAGEIRANGGRATVVTGDISDIAALPGLFQQANEMLGAIDLLVNNAAQFEKDEIGALEQDAWQRQMNTNLAAPVFLSQVFSAVLPDGHSGNIVNIIDQRVWKPVPAFFSYQISKSALWSATIAMAQALAPRVRVNAIGPGPVLPSPRQSVEDFVAQAATVPLGKGPMLEEFGRTIRFIVETASISGQMIALDGGQHLAWETPDVVGNPE